jgi:hypothetical protein
MPAQIFRGTTLAATPGTLAGGDISRAIRDSQDEGEYSEGEVVNTDTAQSIFPDAMPRCSPSGKTNSGERFIVSGVRTCCKRTLTGLP